MPVLIDIQQENPVVDSEHLEIIANFLLKHLNYEDSELSIVCVSDPFISELNEQYRNKKGPTNVLSFSMQEGEFSHLRQNLLGDIIISVDTVLREAKEFNVTFEDRLIFLLIHGLLHLLGYDHETNEKDANLMDQKTQELFSLIKQSPLMMDKTTAQQRIIELSKHVQHHQHLYYIKSQPEISDEAFDRLFDELLTLEEYFPKLALPDSPTCRVGSDLDNTFKTVTHVQPMLSLDKSYTIEELQSWAEKIIHKMDQPVTFVLDEKIDGVSLILTYKEGFLIQAATRGNGILGNDVTENAKTIASIPIKLSDPVTLTVRGEVFIRRSVFKSIERAEGISYENPRNLAAGAMRRKTSKETAKIPLDIFIYDIVHGVDLPSDHHYKLRTFLQSLGFPLNQNTYYFEQPDTSFRSCIEKSINTRNIQDYDIDGLVLKVSEQKIRDILGTTGRFPRWAMAYKFESPQAETQIQGIDIQIGRLGRITPVARLKPVRVGGAEITNATLHNQDYIDELGIAVGDQVTISRRGDVIPAVEAVLEKNSHQNPVWQMPSQCPSCHSPLVREGGHHFCDNSQCPDRQKAALIHFAGKSGMDIENLGPKTIETLISLQLINKVEDIYTFNPESLEGVEGFKDKKIAAIKRGIDDSKKQPFEKVLSALGLKNLGIGLIKLLVKSGINSFDTLIDIAKNNDIDRLIAIKGIEKNIANGIINSFKDPIVLQTIETLISHGFQTESIQQNTDNSDIRSMSGQRWCITGQFEHFKPRSKAGEEIEKQGGEIVSSVSKKTTHLLAGEKAGSKLSKAQALGINIVSEKTFLTLLAKGISNENE